MITNLPPTYRAFLLRIWSAGPEGTLRASVRDIDTGETLAFAGIEQLSEWLRHTTGTQERKGVT